MPILLFCVAHELGHLFLHLLGENGEIRKDVLVWHSPKESSMEWEANEFAAQLLMLQEEFASFCCTISQAAMVRGEILGLW